MAPSRRRLVTLASAPLDIQVPRRELGVLLDEAETGLRFTAHQLLHQVHF